MEKLSSALEEKGLELREAIVEETQRKEVELQVKTFGFCYIKTIFAFMYYYFY